MNRKFGYFNTFGFGALLSSFVLFCVYILAANGAICIICQICWAACFLMGTPCLVSTDICFILTPKEGPQVPLVLEYLPPQYGICHTRPWHHQYFQRLWHLTSCKEMEISLHNFHHCIGCDCLVVGSHYLDCSLEEEVKQVHQALWWIQQWRRQAIVALLLALYLSWGVSTAAHLFSVLNFVFGLCIMALIFTSSIVVYYILRDCSIFQLYVCLLCMFQWLGWWKLSRICAHWQNFWRDLFIHGFLFKLFIHRSL